MTSIGRGRAWGRPGERENVLRRPGKPPSPKTSELEELINKIYNDIRIDEPTSFDALKGLATFADSLADNHSPENLVNKLWKQALEDRCFGIKLMKLYSLENRDGLQTKTNFLASRKVEFFRKMQGCYEKREELRKENPLHLSNLAWILGAIVQNEGPNDAVRYMGPALINCLTLLLETATEEDTETVAIQVCLNGKCIMVISNANKCENPSDKVGLNELVTNARTILVNRNVSCRTRALLLLIIDLANQRYEPLTGDLQAFHASSLAGSRRSQEIDGNFCIGREFNSESYLYGILTKGLRPTAKSENHSLTTTTTPTPTPTPTPTTTTTATTTTHELTRNELPLQQTQKMNRAPSGGGSGPFPRAIRGSGASESSKDHRNEKRSPRGHKDKLTDEQVWSAKQNTGSKVWGHDDRFDNDYE